MFGCLLSAILGVLFGLMMLSGAWRLGGGISDWIENQEAEKKKRNLK